MQKTIFVVDDIDTNLYTAKEVLKNHYRVMTLPSAARMFAMLEKVKPNMILLDIEMPVMDGFEALQLLKENDAYADIPVMFLTSMTDAAVEVRGFEMGVTDFLTKPFSAPVLINRIKAHLEIDSLIRERTAQLQQKTEQLQLKTEQLQNLQNAIIYGFADMVENRDEGTGGHVDRTATYIKILIDAMLEMDVYTEQLKGLDLDSFVSSARLHDVGKIAISDIVLNKPGKLTQEEFENMKTHTLEGERAIDQIASRTDDVEFLNNAKLFAGSHHERWDGKGYPHGLSEENIPIQGRIMALADVYDALVSVRPYKKALTSEEAVKIIMDGAGTQFDPKIAEVFFKIIKQFEAVAL
jgi:putative two-component system response regulator